MSVSTQPTGVYTDLNGLDQLKYQLNGDSVDDLRVVARQFEAIFIQQMFKTMREASLGEGLFDSNTSDLYVDMLDKQMSLNLSEGKGIGLADVIVQQLSKTLNVKPDQTEKTDQHDSDSMSLPQLLQAVQRETNAYVGARSNGQAKNNVQANSNGEIAQNQSTDNKPIINHSGFLRSENTENITDPETFIKSLWPLAQTAAKEIGVTPQVLIAQAALETGWGQYVARLENGKSSHNVFNIKAGSNWQGDTVTLATTEFKNGASVKEYAAFRTYDSYNSAFEDYVAMVKHNPRYQQALGNSASASDYVAGLQQAGYATDPDYSAKVKKIANGAIMTNVSTALSLEAGASQSEI